MIELAQSGESYKDWGVAGWSALDYFVSFGIFGWVSLCLFLITALLLLFRPRWYLPLLPLSFSPFLLCITGSLSAFSYSVEWRLENGYKFLRYTPTTDYGYITEEIPIYVSCIYFGIILTVLLLGLWSIVAIKLANKGVHATASTLRAPAAHDS